MSGHGYLNPDKPASPAIIPKIDSVAPVFSTSNLTRWLKHYEALGFQVRRYVDTNEDGKGGSESDGIYGYANRDGIQLHVAVNPDHDPAATAGCAYLYVNDADALHAIWSLVPDSKRSVAPTNTDYGLREGAHIDPDGNLLRYGSRIAAKGGSGVSAGK